MTELLITFIARWWFHLVMLVALPSILWLGWRWSAYEKWLCHQDRRRKHKKETDYYEELTQLAVK